MDTTATIVSIREAAYIDPRAGNDKFYRTYAFGTSFVSQYGRNGTAGTFTKPEVHESQQAAGAAAAKKFDSKVKKGYNPTRQGEVATSLAEPTNADLDALAEHIGADPTHDPGTQGTEVVYQTTAGDLPDATATVVAALDAASVSSREAVTNDTNPSLPTRPMLASVLPAADVAAAMGSDRWVGQFKYDGDRAVIEVRDGAVTPLNRQGMAKVKNIGKAHIEPFAALGTGRWVFDGEVVGRTLVLFDLVFATDGHRTFVDEQTPFTVRYAALVAITATLGLVDGAFDIAPVATGSQDKADMLTIAVADKREGLILRETGAGYEPGRRAATLVKHKLIKDADVVITALHVTKSSATLAVRDADGNEIQVGNASTIGKVGLDCKAPQVGQTWVVTYLGVTDPANPRLFQPRLVAHRTDKGAAECSVAQFADAYMNKVV